MSKAVTKKDKTHLKKEFDNFFDSPTRGKLESLLRNHFGEQPECDFKENWQELKKMVKHILAISNSGGGCIIVGMAQLKDGKLESKGLPDFLDKAKIVDTFKNYLPNSLLSNTGTYDFDYDDEQSLLKGKKFQVIIIESKSELLPFVSSKDGDGFREGAIYVRRGTSSVEANYEEVQKIINKRIETGFSSSTVLSLQEHFDQLEFLYSLIEKGKVYPKSLVKKFSAIGEEFVKNIANSFEVFPNELYPKESIEEFTSSLISKKKRKIEQELGVDNFSD